MIFCNLLLFIATIFNAIPIVGTPFVYLLEIPYSALGCPEV